MLTECQDNDEYSKAAAARGECYFAESLFMTLIFQQQKMISQLIDKLSKYKGLVYMKSCLKSWRVLSYIE
jgi:hypothetical protein